MPDVAETSLEQTFSDLANARLRDLAPALLDYLVGFQMVECNDDGSRAIGIFGFEIGDAWHYSPVFFFNGEVKGLDSLYSVESDLFVPLNEDWINQLINRRENRLGETDGRSREQRGVRVPNYNRMRQIPTGGGGAAGGLTFGKMGAADIEAKLAAPRDDQDVLDLPTGLSLMGRQVRDGFLRDLATCPKLAAAVRQWYSPIDFVLTVEKVAAAKEKDPVTVISSIAQDGADALTDEQKEQLVAGGMAVVDKRPEMDKSITYRTESKEQLQTPTDGGWYETLMSDGTVRDLLLLKVIDGPDFLAYDPEDGRYGVIASDKVFTLRQHERADFRSKLDDNSVAPGAVKIGDAIVFVNQTGDCSLAFTIDEVNTGINDIKTLHVRSGYYTWSSPCAYIGGYSRIDAMNRGPAPWRYGSPSERIREIVVTEAGGGEIRYTANKLVVNSRHFRAIILNHAKLQSDSYGSFPEWERSPSKDALKPEDFGDHTTIRAALEKVAVAVKMWSDGSEIAIADPSGTYSFNPPGAVNYLIRKHGCAGSDALTMVKEAGHNPHRYLVKRAAAPLPFPPIEDTLDSGFMSNYHQTQVPTRNVQVSEPPQNRQFYEYRSPFGGTDDDQAEDGQSTAETIDAAGKSGQKEVFDAAVLGSLVKTHNPLNLAERFLPTIVSGMDRIGRLLFMLGWHYEDFVERYGQSDLAEFEDNLKSTFESTGELVIFLKKRTLAGDPDFYGLGLNATMTG